MGTYASREVLTGQNSHYHLYMSVRVNSQNVSTNRSNVTVTMYARSDSSSYGAYNLSPSSNSVKMTANGSQVTDRTMAMDFRGQQTVDLAGWTGDIAHGSDGEKRLDCSGSFAISGTSSLSGGSVSCSLQIDTIPRATVPVLSSATIEMGKVLKITLSPAVSSWRHKVCYSWYDSGEVRILDGVTGAQNWTVPLAFADKVPEATSGWGMIHCDTYNGSTLIGRQSARFTATVPASLIPMVSSVTVSEGTAGIAAAFGCYIQNKSTLHVVTAAAGVRGSTIKTVKHVIAGVASTGGTDMTSAVVTGSGDIPVVTTVTDSRGRTSGAKTTVIHAEPYSNPQIPVFACERCKADGTSYTDGTQLAVSAGFGISPVLDKNTKSYKIEYRPRDAENYTTLYSGSVYRYDARVITPASLSFSVTGTYTLRLTVQDYFMTAQAVYDVEMSARLANYIVKKMAWAFGKFAEIDQTLDVGLEALFRRDIALNRFDDKEKHIFWQNDASRQGKAYDTDGVYPHDTYLYGGSGTGPEAFGVYDRMYGRTVLSYDDVKNKLYAGLLQLHCARLAANSVTTLTTKSWTDIALKDAYLGAGAEGYFEKTSDGKLKCLRSGYVVISGNLFMENLNSGDEISACIAKGTNTMTLGCQIKNTNVNVPIPANIIGVGAGDILYLQAINYTNARGKNRTGGIHTYLFAMYVG